VGQSTASLTGERNEGVQMPRSAKPSEAYILATGAVGQAETEATVRLAVEAVEAGAKRLVLGLTSRGGDFRQGVSLANILRALPITLDTYNMGLVASSAVVLFLAGERRFAEPHSMFGFHPSSLTPEGSFTPKQLAEARARLLLDDGTEEEIITERTGMSRDAVRRIVQRSSSLNAEEALERGIVHEVAPLVMPPGALVLSV